MQKLQHGAAYAGAILLALATPAAPAADAADLERLTETGHCPGCDLSGADLSGMRLMSADLSKADLRNANLRKTILFRATLAGADAQPGLVFGRAMEAQPDENGLLWAMISVQ